MATVTTVSRNGIRWREVADALGANLVTASEHEAQVLLHRDGRGRRLILTDNGGEVNVSEIVPAAASSVPYRHGEKRVGPMTLANRILCALEGERIDYALHIDDLEPTHARARHA